MIWTDYNYVLITSRFNSWRGKKTFEKSPDSNPTTASKKVELDSLWHPNIDHSGPDAFLENRSFIKAESDPTPAWKKQKKKAVDAQSRTNSREAKKKDNWQEESPACPKKTETMLITTNRNR